MVQRPRGTVKTGSTKERRPIRCRLAPGTAVRNIVRDTVCPDGTELTQTCSSVRWGCHFQGAPTDTWLLMEQECDKYCSRAAATAADDEEMVAEEAESPAEEETEQP